MPIIHIEPPRRYGHWRWWALLAVAIFAGPVAVALVVLER